MLIKFSALCALIDVLHLASGCAQVFTLKCLYTSEYCGRYYTSSTCTNTDMHRVQCAIHSFGWLTGWLLLYILYIYMWENDIVLCSRMVSRAHTHLSNKHYGVCVCVCSTVSTMRAFINQMNNTHSLTCTMPKYNKLLCAPLICTSTTLMQ